MGTCGCRSTHVALEPHEPQNNNLFHDSYSFIGYNASGNAQRDPVSEAAPAAALVSASGNAQRDPVGEAAPAAALVDVHEQAAAPEQAAIPVDAIILMFIFMINLNILFAQSKSRSSKAEHLAQEFINSGMLKYINLFSFPINEWETQIKTLIGLHAINEKFTKQNNADLRVVYDLATKIYQECSKDQLLMDQILILVPPEEEARVVDQKTKASIPQSYERRCVVDQETEASAKKEEILSQLLALITKICRTQLLCLEITKAGVA